MGLRFTKKEIIFLIACVAIALALALSPPIYDEANEVFLIILIALPLGLWIVTDPERKKSKG